MKLTIQTENEEKFAFSRDIARDLFTFVLFKRFDVLQKSFPRVEGLTKFDADKTMRFVNKFWEYRASVNSKSRKIFIFPVLDKNDKHGHRIAFPDQMPVLESIELYDEIVTESYQHFKQILVLENGVHVKKLIPQISSSSLLPLLNNGIVTEEDIGFLENIGISVGLLSDFEVIAIGRHETPDKTLDSLHFEIDRWLYWMEEFINLISSQDIQFYEFDKNSICDYGWKCWSYAYECMCKVHWDRSNYEKAFTKLNTSFEDKKLKQYSLALKAFQSSADQIWDDHRIVSLCYPIGYCWSISQYLAGTLKGIFGEQMVRPNVTIADAENGYKNIQCFYSANPQNRPLNFDLKNVDTYHIKYGYINENVIGISPNTLLNDHSKWKLFGEGIAKMVEQIKEFYIKPSFKYIRNIEPIN